MPSTYTLISSNVLSSSAASVTFSAIPSTYTDLVLRCSTRHSSTQTSMRITFNSDSATNYSETAIYGNGSAASSQQDPNVNFAYLLNYIVPSTYTASTFSNNEIYIPNYTASANKPFSGFGTQENNATASNIAGSAFLWRNTAAITSIQLALPSGDYVAGSSFYLYGISKN